ncbi:hypothetical protein [Streptomyces sp. NPDC017529]|uniref:hypothetical protein n=1 Tax=Streptomyces sp. NPDC017529 TaxID=3365000 RepID=UPI00379B5DA6
MNAALTSLIAIAGTLLGAALQHYTATRTHQAATAEARRTELKTAAHAFVTALTAYREQRLARWELQHPAPGTPAPSREELAASKTAVRAARTTVNTALINARLLAAHRALAPYAHTALDATYALKKAADRNELEQLHRTVLDAQDAYLDAAADVIAEQ